MAPSATPKSSPWAGVIRPARIGRRRVRVIRSSMSRSNFSSSRIRAAGHEVYADQHPEHQHRGGSPGRVMNISATVVTSSSEMMRGGQGNQVGENGWLFHGG